MYNNNNNSNRDQLSFMYSDIYQEMSLKTKRNRKSNENNNSAYD